MAQNPLAALLAQRVAAWNQTHPSSQFIDPHAELSVSQMEGLSGGIGDGGHAFGPNQLNNAGGVLTGKFAGQTPQQINSWAWSPQGIDYALAGVANAAGGLRGSQAVNAIVSKFERPANPGREIAGALRAYGLPVPAATSAAAPGIAAFGTGGAVRARPVAPIGPGQQQQAPNPIAMALRFLGF